MNCLSYSNYSSNSTWTTRTTKPETATATTRVLCTLLAQVYQLDLSRPRFSFLLGSEANDEAAHVVSE